MVEADDDVLVVSDDVQRSAAAHDRARLRHRRNRRRSSVARPRSERSTRARSSHDRHDRRLDHRRMPQPILQEPCSTTLGFDEVAVDAIPDEQADRRRGRATTRLGRGRSPTSSTASEPDFDADPASSVDRGARHERHRSVRRHRAGWKSRRAGGATPTIPDGTCRVVAAVDQHLLPRSPRGQRSRSMRSIRERAHRARRQLRRSAGGTSFAPRPTACSVSDGVHPSDRRRASDSFADLVGTALVVGRSSADSASRSTSRSETARIGPRIPTYVLTQTRDRSRRRRMVSLPSAIGRSGSRRERTVWMRAGVLLAELRPEAPDVDVDRAGAAVVLVAPHPAEEDLAGEHLAGVLGEELEQLVLHVGHVERPPGDGRLVRLEVERRGRRTRRGRRCWTSVVGGQQMAQPCFELGRGGTGVRQKSSNSSSRCSSSGS